MRGILWGLVFTIPLWLAVVVLSGCSGLGLKVEGYRIDEMEGAQKTHKLPLKCWFVPCNEMEAK